MRLSARGRSKLKIDVRRDRTFTRQQAWTEVVFKRHLGQSVLHQFGEALSAAPTPGRGDEPFRKPHANGSTGSSQHSVRRRLADHRSAGLRGQLI